MKEKEDTSEPTMEHRIEAKIVEVTTARDNARQQLNGLENQLYVLQQLLNPEPPVDPVPVPVVAPPDGEEAIERPNLVSQGREEAPEDPPPDGVPIKAGEML